MSYRIDIKFVNAIQNNDIDELKRYLDRFSKDSLKYQEVELEFKEGKFCDLPFNQILWEQFRFAYMNYQVDAREMLLNYIIDRYKNEPQAKIGIPEIISYFIMTSTNGDICHKIIDNGLVSKEEYQEMLDIASTLVICNEQDIISKIFKLVEGNINEYDSTGHSHLGRAISENSLDRLKLLLENGASLDLPVSKFIEGDDKYPIAFAKSCNRDAMAEYMEEFQARKRSKEIDKNIAQESLINKRQSNKVKRMKIRKIGGFK